MKNGTIIKKLARSIGVIALMLGFCISLSVMSFGGDDAFEKEIAAFPEDYKPYLRQLHEQYPDWKFNAFETGLDFDTVIDNEVGLRSLVSNSSASVYLKNREIDFYDPATYKYVDFYNYSTGKYIEKDSGFVGGNRLAVEYYIDPRNFLTEENIFQFEDLSFSDTLTVDSVNAVLKGSYMYKATMDYLDSEGNTVTVKKTYAEAIYEAGKKYDINPCYIASKILNEVGSDGSGSSLGYYKSSDGTVIRGVYNLYNIGAYDGSSAIKSGLTWAGSGSTYGRPWTSPAKSIAGGAEYLAEKYIGIGQFTGYLQRFNVNSATGKLYSHQYMTNLTGALSQGYTNYLSYVKMNLLQREIIFSIPVYKNMPEMSAEGEDAVNADSAIQKGNITASYCYVRTGSSTNNAKLYDASSKVIQLSSGTAVEILGKVKTDADYYLSVLQYPFWYNIRFTYNSKSYEGYVPATFVEITDVTQVGIGEYTLPIMAGEGLSLNIISQNVNIAKVTGDGKVKFLKEGKVEIITYNSVGEFDSVMYEVVKSPCVTGTMTASKYEKSLKFTIGKTDGAKAYQFMLFDGNGMLVATAESTSTTCEFKSLTSTKRYYCYARPVVSDGVYGATAYLTAITAPGKPASFKAEVADEKVTFSWKKVSGATGYNVYGYDTSTQKYTKIGGATTTSLTASTEKLAYDSYCVRAYVKDSLGSTNSSYSAKITVSTYPYVPKGIEVTDVTKEGYTISWENAANAASYEVYAYDSEKKDYVLLSETKETLLTVTGKAAGQRDKYKIRSLNSDGASAFTDELSISTLPGKTSSFKAGSITASAATLSWKVVSGADIYRAYNSKGKLLGETEKLTLKVSDLTQVTSYSYTIKACVKNLDTVFEGEGVKVTFKTELATVTNLSCTSKGYDYFTVSWTKNSKADSYRVYLYNANKKQIAEKKTESTSYKFSSLDSNKTYYVSVRCVDGDILSDYTSKLTVKTGATAPTGMASESVSTTSYTLTWKKVPEAYSYRIYKKSGSSYKFLKEVKTTSYKVSGLSAGTANSYKITTKVKDGSKYYESPRSAAFSASTKPGKVTGLKTSVASTTTTVSWTAVKGAAGYKVYLYENGKYVSKATVTGTSYKLTGLSAGKSYKYAVRAYAKPSTGAVSGSYAYGDFITKPAKVSSVSVSSVKSDSHVLSWGKSSGANFYYVYRYDTAKKKYIEVGGTSKTQYTVPKLVSGTTYKYKITSALLSGGKCIVKGSDSDVYSFTTAPVQVKSLKATASSGKLSLSWTACSGATGYAVYYYDEAAETYLSAGTTTKNSFTMSGLSSGRTMKIKVRAYRTLDGKKYYGSYSSVVTVKTK